MPGFHELLAALDPGPSGHRVLHFHSLIAVGDDTIPLKPPSAEPLVCQRGVFVEPQRGLLLGAFPGRRGAFYDRFMHVGLGSNYVYTTGRHHMSGSVTQAENDAFYDGGIILKYMWCAQPPPPPPPPPPPRPPPSPCTLHGHSRARARGAVPASPPSRARTDDRVHVSSSPAICTRTPSASPLPTPAPTL